MPTPALIRRLTLSLMLMLMLMLVLFTQACSDLSPAATPLPTATPTPINPQAILDDCGQAMSALKSFRFRIEHSDEGGTPVAQGMTLTEASGSVANPDRLALDFVGVAGSFAVKGSLIAIGDEVYMTNPLSGEWHAASAINPLEFFNPSQGIAEILSQVQDATLISQDADEFRIGGTFTADALSPLFGDTEVQSKVDVTLSIDKPRLYLTKATLEGRITPMEADGIVRTITLSEFDEPVEIAVPGK